MSSSNNNLGKLAFNNPLPLRKVNVRGENLSLRGPNLNRNFGNPIVPKKLIDEGQGGSLRYDNLAMFMAKGKAERVKRNQDRVSQTVEAPTSTTTSSSTTGTTSSTTSSSPPKSQTTSRQDTSMNRETRSNNNNRTTSSDNNRNRNIAFDRPALKEGAPFNLSDNSPFMGTLYGTGLTSKIPFSLSLQNIMFMNDYELSNNSASESRIKLFLRGTSFADQFANAPFTDYQNNLVSLFAKFNVDVANTLNSYTSPNWDSIKFRTALYNVCKGLEIYYALDSILSYNSGSMGGYTCNRTYEKYRNVLAANNDILAARNKLRSALKGMWFPPNFSALLRWFYQSYKVSNLDQAPIFRFIPIESLYVSSTSDNTLISTFDISSVLASLDATEVSAKITAVLKKVYPSGIIGNLPESCSDAVYDPIMAEVFVNDCIVFTDVSNSSTTSYYPISYETVKNDIPYYMSTNPTEKTNGLAYALQSIPTATGATTGYVPNYVYGLRKPITAQMKDQNSVSDVTNLQIVTDYATGGALRGYAKPYNEGNTFKSVNSNDAHNRSFYYTQSSSSSTLKVNSKCLNDYQRVFFNNGEAPKVVFSALLGNLYHTKP